MPEEQEVVQFEFVPLDTFCCAYICLPTDIKDGKVVDKWYVSLTDIESVDSCYKLGSSEPGLDPARCSVRTKSGDTKIVYLPQDQLMQHMSQKYRQLHASLQSAHLRQALAGGR